MAKLPVAHRRLGRIAAALGLCAALGAGRLLMAQPLSSPYPPATPMVGNPPAAAGGYGTVAAPTSAAAPNGAAPTRPSVYAAAQAAPQDEPVVDVRIEGLRTVPKEKLLGHVRTRAGRPFDPSVVEEDVKRLNRSRLCASVKPLTRRVQGGWEVVFQVMERPLLSDVKIVGNVKVRAKKLTEEIRLKPGDPQDPFAVEEGRRVIEEYYRKQGFGKVRVTVLEGNQAGDSRAVYVINEGPKQRVLWTRFVGNTIASDARLRTQIQTKPPMLYLFKGEVNRETIEGDVERLTAYYRSLGFMKARISREMEFNEEQDWLVLTFVIHEGPRFKVRNVAVLGNSKIATEQLTSGLKLKAGDYYSVPRKEADVASVQEQYGRIGYIFADVKSEVRFLDDDPEKVDLVYNLSEGDRYRVGRVNVEISGENPHTRLTAVMNQMSLKPGDIVDIRKLRDSERRLRASGLFLVDPLSGNVPKIAYSPPDSEDGQTQVANRRRGNFRGQSPDGADEVRDAVLHIVRERPDAAGSWKLQYQSSQPPAAAGGYRASTAPSYESGGYGTQAPPSYGTGALQSSATPNYGAAAPVEPLVVRGQYTTELSPADRNRARPWMPWVKPQPQPNADALPPPNGLVAPQPPAAYPPSAYPPSAYPPASAGGYGTGTAPSYGAAAAPNYGAAAAPNYAAAPPAAYAAQPYPAAVPEPNYQPVAPGGYPPASAGGYGASAAPNYRDPTAPNYGARATPNYNAPATPNYGAPAVPYGAPVAPNYGTPAAPNYGVEAATAPPALPPMNQSIYDPRQSPFLNPGPDARELPLNVRVSETQTGRFMLGVGVNSDAGLVGSVILDEQNFDWTRWPRSWRDIYDATAFRGAGQRLRIEAVPGTQVQRYMASFQEPYFLNSDISFGLSGFFYDRLYREWKEQRLGGRISLGYHFTKRLSGSMAVRAERVNVRDPIDPTLPVFQEALGNSALYGFSGTLAHDTRDSPFLATEGHLVEMTFEQVIGRFQYPRGELDLRQYFLLWQRPDTSGRHVLSVTGKMAVSGGNTPIYDHYYAGGFSTIRGFDFRGASPIQFSPIAGDVPVGGHFMLLASAEYMFPITADDMLRAVVFCDTGTVQPSIDNWQDKYRVAPGFGFRITIPAMGPAPIAFDFAFPVVANRGDREQVFSFFLGVLR